MMWRKKELPLSEWAAFQERFAEFQMMLLSHPDLAMFSTGDSDGDKEIFVTGLYIHVIEEASPGGWKDCEKPSGEGVSLLVGTPDSWERLGVRPVPA